jgi:alkylation response protein AidB-like acyl-CoA dehydrogenase
MDFDDTPTEAAFRRDARAWLEAHAEVLPDGAGKGGLPRGDAVMPAVKAWQRTLYEGGWAGIAWPRAWGGRGGDANQAAVFRQEQARFAVPYGPLMVGTDMVGPTIITHGTDAQKRRYLDAILRGDEVWCQLFSEPEAGSDLASLTTKAVRKGDDWEVNGQKVWTSGAQYSDWGILLARSRPDVAKHRGITCFLLDMRTPGVEVRPLRQISGIAHFNEVFLTGVRIPHDHVLGEVDGGWGVALTMLANERSAIGGGRGTGTWASLLELARATGGDRDPVRQQQLAEAFTRIQLLRYLSLRTQTARSRGLAPGPEGSVMKLLMSRHAGAIGDLVLALQGPGGTLAGDWADLFLNQWSLRIGGGTDQIQRNVIGERTLGLPPEPRVDKAVPFNELRRGARL